MFKRTMCPLKILKDNGLFDLKDELTINDALEAYGYCKQGAYGDVQGERPPWYEVQPRMKWDAWNENKGMDIEIAKRECLDFLLPMLQEN